MKKNRNRVIAMLLIAVMLMGSFSGCGADSDQSSSSATEAVTENATDNATAETATEEAKESYGEIYDRLAEKLSLPEVGDAISGFTVKRIMDYPWRNGVLIEMEYDKTGTPLIFLANEDEDKAFTAAYLTRTDSNKGIPHIFEHVTLSGSTEYPNASLFDAISGGTYNTYMNASTSIECTSYEFASLSDEQLIAIARYYLSGLADPLALKDSNPLGREAYRYQLYDENDDINVTGAVYNEMESSNSRILRGVYQSVLSTLYPGSYMSHNSGGVRDDIMTVTLEELQSYYDIYYHPSNMLITLYGNVDYVSFLEFLDKEYLSKYDKKEVNIEDTNYKPWSGYKEIVVDFPAEEGSEVKDQSEVIYVITLPNISDYDLGLIENIAGMMCADGSSLIKRIEAEYPSCSLQPYFERDLDVPFFGFLLNNANEGDEKRIKDIINDEFEKVVREGFDKDILEGFANNKEAEILIKADAHGGTDQLGDICGYWTTHGKSIDGYVEYLNGTQSILKANEEGKLQELVTEYILNPETSASIAVVPRPGLYEEQWEKHMQILRDMKESMSDEEIQELIASTNEFDEWSNKTAETADISDFAAVDIEDVDASFDKPEITKSQEDNACVYSYDLGDVGYATTGALLSADCVPVDKIYDFKLAAALLGNLATAKHDDSQLTVCMDRDLYDYNLGSYLYHDYMTGEPHIVLRYEYTALSRNIDKGAEYFDEIINSTEFTDIDRIKYVINTEYNDVKYNLENSTISFIKAYELALGNDNYKIDYYTQGFGYLSYLKELTQMSDEEIESKMSDVEDVIDMIKNQNNVIFYVYGDSNDLQNCHDDMFKIISGFSDEKLEKTDFAGDFPELKKVKKVAIITNDSSTFNGIFSSAAAEVVPYSGTVDAATRYIQNNIVYPAFRYDIGAYSGWNYYTSDGRAMYVMSYRDTQVNKSFEFMKSLPELVGSVDVVSEDLDASKLRSFSDLAYPETDASIVRNEIYNDIFNKGSYIDRINTILKDIKAVTSQDVTNMVNAYQIMVDEGLEFSYGGASKIKEAGGYDLIIEDLVK